MHKRIVFGIGIWHRHWHIHVFDVKDPQPVTGHLPGISKTEQITVLRASRKTPTTIAVRFACCLQHVSPAYDTKEDRFLFTFKVWRDFHSTLTQTI